MAFVFYTVEEADILEAAYQKGYERALEEARSIAKTMGRKEENIKGWFARRRKKDDAAPLRPFYSRQPFTDTEKECMEKTYRKNQRPLMDEMRKIAKKLDMDVRRVRAWFSARRSRDNLTIPQRPPLTKEQKRNLEPFYVENNYPTNQERDAIAKKIGANPKQVFVWFATRRRKAKLGLIVTKEPKQESRDPPEIVEFDSAKTEILEAAYKKNSVPTSDELQQLQDSINIDVDQIKFWFSQKHRDVYYLRLKSKQQLDALEQAYLKNKYLNIHEMKELGDRIGLTKSQVRTWSKARRSKDKDFDENLLVLPVVLLKSPEQRLALKEAYQKSKYLQREEMFALADRTGLKKKRVQEWFTAQRKQDKDFDCSLYRKRYHPDRMQILEAAFQKNSKPSKTELEDLSKITGLTFMRVKSMFVRFRKKFGCPQLIQRYTSHQRSVLLEAYNENPYPSKISKEKMTEIASQTGLTDQRIKTWFKTHRRTATVTKADQDMVEIKTEHLDQKLDDVDQKMSLRKSSRFK